LYHKLLSLATDEDFYVLLRLIDDDLARMARAQGCTCGGKLHSADYPRKPRGGPKGVRDRIVMRASFCCAEEGCRRRKTPPSVRFLGRKVYFTVVVLLLPILQEGATPLRVRRLRALFRVSQRTLQRWRKWWLEVVPQTQWWQAERAQRGAGFETERELPGSLLVGLLERDGSAIDRARAVLVILLRLACYASRPIEHAR
jgi:hypothetical protein